MKKTKLILATLSFIFFAQTAIKAQSTQRITLQVNTSSISARTVNSAASFGQDTEEVSNEDFTVNVSIGDEVIWDGISTSSNKDEVLIISINHEGGARLFAKNVLRGEGGVVSDVVASSDGDKRIQAGDTEKYTIRFRVVRNGETLPGVFQIDPKLVVKQ